MPYKDKEVAKLKSEERWIKWAKENPEKANDRMRKWRRRNPEYMLHVSARRRAERDGTEFSITKEDIPSIPEICPVALIPIHFREDKKKGPCDNSPTLDRVDPEKGYVKNNLRILSHKGNRWKSDMTISDVERLLNYMKSHPTPGLQGETVQTYVNALRNL